MEPFLGRGGLARGLYRPRPAPTFESPPAPEGTILQPAQKLPIITSQQTTLSNAGPPHLLTVNNIKTPPAGKQPSTILNNIDNPHQPCQLPSPTLTTLTTLFDPQAVECCKADGRC